MTPFQKKLAAGKRRRELRERAVQYLGGSCRICGYAKCASAMDFHHINAIEKDFTIAARMTSWEAIERELRKCILLCACCHREVHEGLHPSYLEDETHMRGGYDERQIDMFEDPEAGDVTVQEAMETEDELLRSFDVPVTMQDLLAPSG
jgi:hypothetical protein